MGAAYKNTVLRSRLLLRLFVVIGLAVLFVYGIARRPRTEGAVSERAAASPSTVASTSSAVVEPAGADAGEIVLVDGPCPAGFVKLAPLAARAPCFTACDATADCPRGLSCMDEETVSGAKVKLCALAVPGSPSATPSTAPASKR